MNRPVTDLVSRIASWLGSRARLAIIVGCSGAAICIIAFIAVKLRGTRFLPLDYEGKISIGAALVTTMLILAGAFASAIISGVPTLCAWRHLPAGMKLAGFGPVLLIVAVWIALITLTGM